jgi:hypothetical protein
MKRRAPPLGYRAALRWLIANDDTSFLDSEEQYLSVTATLIADIYDRTDEEVLRDLLRLKGHRKESAENALAALAL